MSRAIRLAERGRYTADPNPRVGCVVVKNDAIIAEGWHATAGGPHAEVAALARAANANGATCYVTLEPCGHQGRTPPCSEALINAGVRKVIVGMIDPNPEVSGKGIQQLNNAGIKTVSGLMERQAALLNPGFIRRMKTGRPHICCKLAMSMDARTALANGESQWITSERSRRDAHGLRAASSALITGIGTVLADDPLMTVRDFNRPFLPPIKVIIDAGLQTPVDARILSPGSRTLIFTLADDPHRKQRLAKSGAEVIKLDDDGKRHWLKNIVRYLAEKEAVNEVLLEAGASLSGSFIENDLVDELIIYMAPKLMGDAAKPLFKLPQFEQLSDCPQLSMIDVRTIGSDIRIRAIVNKK